MAKSNLINSLFKIDAAEGLVRYTNTIKPYHSKIMDVLIEYIYKETVRVKVSEKWNTDITQQHGAQSCYYQVVNEVTAAGAGGVWYIQGHHQEKFRAGDRFLVTYSDASSKTFIVDHALNSVIVEPTDPYRTAVHVIAQQTVPNKTAASIQLTVTPDYKIVGAVTGTGGSWIIDGDYIDEFQVGEQIIIANTSPNELGAGIYTVKEQPYPGYVPGVSVDGNQIPDQTPDLNIVGVRPSRIERDLNVLDENALNAWVIYPGQWIVLGQHTNTLPSGSHVSVTNNPTSNEYYIVDTTERALYPEFNIETVQADDNKWRITTLDPAEIIIGETISVTNNDFDESNKTYEVVSVTTVSVQTINVNGVDVNYYTVDIEVAAGTIPQATTASGQLRRLLDVKIQPHQTYLQNQYVTIITVKPSQEISQSAQPSGILQSPIIPVYEIVGVAGNEWKIAGQYAERFRAGDHLFVSDNEYGPANGMYVVAADSIPPTVEPYVTTVVVSGTIPPSATASGRIQHPSRRTTIIPVVEPVFHSQFDIIAKTTTTWTINGHRARYFGIGGKIKIGGYVDANGVYTDANGVYTVVGVEETPGAGPTTILTVLETIPSTATTTDGYIEKPAGYKAFGTGTLRYAPLITYSLLEPEMDNVPVGAVWVHPITNVSQRWDGSQWIHNYTRTNYSWSLDYANPKELKIVSAVGQIDDTADPQYGVSNTFLVDTTNEFQSASFSTTSLSANQFVFSRPYTITGFDSTENKWIISGEVDIKVGETVYVTSSTNKQGWGKYTVASTVHTAGTTEVYVTKQISRLSSPDGILSVSIDLADIPRWVEGTKVKVSTSESDANKDGLPDPLVFDAEYYFIPVVPPLSTVSENEMDTPSIFALSKVRKPRNWTDYVDITTFGSGILTVTQDEIYVPGTHITVRDTFNSRNNGTYTIIRTTNESSARARVYVNERVHATSPTFVTYDGVMAYDLDSHVMSSLTERSCPSKEQSLLYAATNIHEYIQFEFIMDDIDFVTAQIEENQPYTGFIRDFGYDVPSHDTSGFDGDLVFASNMSVSSATTNTFIHSVIPTGFDTQYFDVGGIDESTSTVTKKYGKTV